MKKMALFCFTVGGLLLMWIVLEHNFHFSVLFLPNDKSLLKNREGYMEQLKRGMLNGEKKIIIKTVDKPKEIKQFAIDVVQDIFNSDDQSTSSDFDYLRYHYKEMDVSIKGIGGAFTVEYNIEYLESKNQTIQVNEKIKEIFHELDIDNQTDYEKIKRIHNFIVRNTAYDLEVEANSAYSALIEGKSACQGYTTLFYKMAAEAGIPCRIVAGTADGEPHAWNIVQLNELWYNIDCTWDDPIGILDKDYVSYDHFLKSDEDFKEHVREEEYRTKDFYEEYKMSHSSFAP